MQPTAQAAGPEAPENKNPGGAKERNPRDGGRDAGATDYTRGNLVARFGVKPHREISGIAVSGRAYNLQTVLWGGAE